MAAAADALPTSMPLPYTDVESRLVGYLLKYGERESVVTYLQRTATTWPEPEAARRRSDAADIRAGYMPTSYVRALRPTSQG